MARTIRVPDPVYSTVERVAKEHDYTRKEAVRHIAREAGYDV